MAPSGIADAVVIVTGLSLAVSTGLGLAVIAGWQPPDRWRWLHHGADAASILSCLLTVAIGVATGSPVRWAMAVLLIPLAAATRTRVATIHHTTATGAALTLWGVIVLLPRI